MSVDRDILVNTAADTIRANITDILCIGTQKGSTSWLHSVLATHPDVAIFPDSEPLTSTNKEAHYWDRNHALGEEWYRTLMTPTDPALKSMDFTPEYAFLPDAQIADCKRLNPTAKVIYVLRDPMARAVSALRMRMLWRFGAGASVRLDLDTLLPEMLPWAQIDEHGSFVRNVEAWKRHYPDILVMNYEDFHVDRTAGIAQIMAHVGLDPARLTGERRDRFDAVMAGKVWESEKFAVDRDALIFLQGYTARTRATVKNVLGMTFTEGQKMIDAAGAPHAAPAAAPILDDLRAELASTRAAVNDQRALLNEIRGEVQGTRVISRLTLDKTMLEIEEEIEQTYARVQVSMGRTLDLVHEHRLSLSRYGDGELMLMTDPDHNLHFQRNSAELRAQLGHALNPDWLAPGKVLVCLPERFRGNLHWMGVWTRNWPTLRAHLHPDARYGNSMVSRPLFFQRRQQGGVDQWRRLWQGRPVLVVTGKGSRFDLLPALFDAVGSVDTLHTQPLHAFADADSIVERVAERATRDTLVLLSLGPTATVLAHRIAAKGIQALDIGHISASYNNVFANGLMPEKIAFTRNT